MLSEAELDYVAAAKLRTERMPHILFKEILPNLADALQRQISWQLTFTVGSGAGTLRPLVALSPILAEIIAVMRQQHRAEERWPPLAGQVGG